MTPLRDDERREPLPGVFGLPAHLLRQLSPRARRWAIAGIAVALLAVIVGVLALAPGIEEAKQRDADAERARLAQVKEERLERLREEVQPRRGRAPQLAVAGPEEPDALRRRSALVLALEQGVLEDARARVESGELRKPVRAAACEEFPRRASGPPPEERLSEPAGRYECVAVTSRIVQREKGIEGLIGYPFRARADFRDGTFAWCKISGRAGEGGLEGQPEVEVPRTCGGG
jgi:hypothetical protein